MLFQFSVIISLLSVAHGLKVHGNVDLKGSTHVFLGKFCFTDYKSKNFTYDNNPSGAIDLQIDGLRQNTQDYVFIAYDNANYDIFKSDTSLTCAQQTNNNPKTGGIANMRVPITSAQFTQANRLKEHLVPRWWYAFLFNCNASAVASQQATYAIHFYQWREGDWTKEFGVNEEGLNSMYLFFSCFYTLIAALQIFAYFKFKSQQYVHQLIKILTWSVVLQLIGSILHFVDWATFAENGEHMMFFVYASQVFDILSMTCFMILLFLLAQGWTISNLGVQYVGAITCFSVTVAAFRIGFFAWRYEAYVMSESVKYFFNSPPMYAYGSLMIIVGLAFAVQCYLSARAETNKQKQRLYLMLGALYMFWFFTPLLTILLANAVAEYYRDTFAQAFSASCDGIAIVVMVGLMYPTWAHQYFNLKVGLDAQSMLINQTGDYHAVSSGMTTAMQEDEL